MDIIKAAIRLLAPKYLILLDADFWNMQYFARICKLYACVFRILQGALGRMVKFIYLRFKLTRYPVAVNIIGDFYAAMAQLIAYVPYVMASEQPDRCVCVPKIMDSNFSQIGLIQTFL